MKKTGAKLMTCLLLMLALLLTSAWAEETGTLLIELDAAGSVDEMACTIAADGMEAARGVIVPGETARFEGLAARDYVITLTLPEDAALTALNGYQTLQTGTAQWIGGVTAGAESLYVASLEQTGALTGSFAQLTDAVTVQAAGPRSSASADALEQYTLEGLLPDAYTVTVLLPAGEYADDAQGAVRYTVTDDGNVAAVMEAIILSGRTTALPAIRRITSAAVSGLVTDSQGHALSGVRVTLLDDAGREAASVLTDETGAWQTDVPLGTYTVRYDAPAGSVIADGAAVVQADGQAFLTAVAGTPASVTVYAFGDANNNGTLSKNETGVPGVTMALIAADGVTVAASGVTDADGYVTLTAPEGEYTLQATAPADYAFGKKGTAIRFAHSIMDETLEQTQRSETIRLSAEEALEIGVGMEHLASVTGHYWHDLNGDGLWQEDEPGMPGLRVSIAGVRNGYDAETVTDANGMYTFTRLKTGAYDVTYYVPDGYVFTVKASGDIARRSRMTTEANREDEDRIDLDRGDVMTDRNIGLMTECVIEGVCFLDANYNGIFDEGEPVLPGVELKLSRQSNNVLLQTVVSDENGVYRFDGLRGSTFGIRALLPDGCTYTVAVDAPDGNQFPENNGKRERKITNITVENGGHTRILLGAIKYGSMTGVLYYDDNFSSAWESGEKIVQGQVITLWDAQGEKVATSKTTKSGAYTFNNLAPGEYRVTASPVKGYAFTAPGTGNILHNLPDGTGESDPITLPIGENLTHLDIGMIEPAVVTGVAFADANDNGLYDKAEKGLAGTVVKLMTATGVEAETEVDKNGEFRFDALMPGEYYLRYELPENGVFSPRVEGGNAVVGEGSIGAGDWFTVKAGDVYEAPVCGGLDLGVIAGLAYADPNGNGQLEEGESLLSGMTITLTPSRADLAEQTIVTGADGAFRMEGLRPDTYTLTVTCPENCVLSRLPGVTLGLTAGLESQSIQVQVGMGAQWEDQRLGCVMPSTWSGMAAYDENDDGLLTPDEAPASGETVILRDADTGEDLRSTLTGEDGAFTIEGIAPGRYVLVFPLTEGLRVPKVGDSTFTLQGNELVSDVLTVEESKEYTGALLAIVRETTLAGHVWLEEGGATTPVTGAMVALLDAAGVVLAEQTTAADGAYAFAGLMPGDYTIDVMLPEGCAPVKDTDDLLAETGLTSILTRTSGTNGSSGVISVKMAQHQLKLDIGSVLPGRLGDRCWLDLNGNGLQDGDEGGLPGVTIELLRDGEVVATAVSDQYGYYAFHNVYPTTYTLRVTWPAEVQPTVLRPELKLIVSVLQADGTSIPVSVESNASNYNADLGFVLLNEKKLPEGYGEGEAQVWKKK